MKMNSIWLYFLSPVFLLFCLSGCVADPENLNILRKAESFSGLSVAGGLNHNLVINKTGELWVWGRGSYGRIGDGSTNVHRNSPKKLPLRSSTGLSVKWKKADGGGAHSMAITETGELYTWGNNSAAQLGDGTTVNKHIPTRIGIGKKWKEVVASNISSVAITETGELYAWGSNDNGRLGDGSTTQRTSPVKINHTTGSSVTKWKAIAAETDHVLAITETGELYTWGGNGNGQLGDGTTTQRTSPVKISHPTAPGTKWKKLGTGENHSLAITETGELYAWGLNNFGQLGDGTTINRNIPTRISDSTNWEEVFGGKFHSLASKKNSEHLVYSWGGNQFGQLGHGTANPAVVATPMKTKALVFWGI